MCHLSSLCELQGTCLFHVVAALTQVLTRVEKFCPSLSLRHESLKSFLSIFQCAVRWWKGCSVCWGNRYVLLELGTVTDNKLYLRLGAVGWSCWLSLCGWTCDSCTCYWSGSVLVWSQTDMEFLVFLFWNSATFMIVTVLQLLAEVKNWIQRIVGILGEWVSCISHKTLFYGYVRLLPLMFVFMVSPCLPRWKYYWFNRD